MKHRRALLLAAAFGLLGAVSLYAQSNPMDTIEKMKMRWDLGYKFKVADIVKYEMDTISSVKSSSYNVAESGSEANSETARTTRVYLTQRVIEIDEQNVTSLEFVFDNVVDKYTEGGKEMVLDSSGAIGRKFTVRVSAKGKLIDIEGSGDTEDFKKTVQTLFLVFPDKTLKIGDEWDDKREDTTVDQVEGLQVDTTNAIKYRVDNFEEYQRSDAVVINIIETIDQNLLVRKDDPGGTVVSTNGQGTGKGTSKGKLRVNAKTGQLLTFEMNNQLRNTITVDEEQLVGATIRTKYTTEVTTTTNIRLQ